MTTKPDTISIRASDERELVADSATLSLIIEGAAIFSGDNAFKKAKEVQALIAVLHECGVTEEQISLRDLRVQSDQLIGIKTSSCLYTIQVNKVSAERMSDTMSGIAGLKRVNMQSIRWNFSTLESEIEHLRLEVIGKAKDQAAATAAALGVDLWGVYRFEESIARPGEEHKMLAAGAMLRSKSKKASPPNLGIPMTHRGTLRLAVEAEFRVSPFVGVEARAPRRACPGGSGSITRIRHGKAGARKSVGRKAALVRHLIEGPLADIVPPQKV